MTSNFGDATTGLSDNEETRPGRGIPRCGLGNFSDHSKDRGFKGAKEQGSGIDGSRKSLLFEPVWPP